MLNKPNQESNPAGIVLDDFKDPNTKSGLSRFDYDLYKEEDDVTEKVIRVKRIAFSKGERWKIFEDAKVMFTVEGSKLTNKEREFLRTAEGVIFLINRCKHGIRSFNALKKEIKKRLSSGS